MNITNITDVSDNITSCDNITCDITHVIISHRYDVI